MAIVEIVLPKVKRTGKVSKRPHRGGRSSMLSRRHHFSVGEESTAYPVYSDLSKLFALDFSRRVPSGDSEAGPHTVTAYYNDVAQTPVSRAKISGAGSVDNQVFIPLYIDEGGGPTVLRPDNTDITNGDVWKYKIDFVTTNGLILTEWAVVTGIPKDYSLKEVWQEEDEILSWSIDYEKAVSDTPQKMNFDQTSATAFGACALASAVSDSGTVLTFDLERTGAGEAGVSVQLGGSIGGNPATDIVFHDEFYNIFLTP